MLCIYWAGTVGCFLETSFIKPSSATNPRLVSDVTISLAGLQAGCLGSLLMIAWWLLGEIAMRRSAWIVPNLLATTFYGELAYRSGFSWHTCAGLALPFLVYSAFGVVFALIGRARRGGVLLVFAGLAFGIFLNWFLFDFSMRRLNPFVTLYAPDRLIAISNLLYGTALATYPGFARRLASSFENTAASQTSK